MTETSAHLPQFSGDVFLTDGGLETDLIFNDGVDVPEFASFVLLKDEAGTEALSTHYRRFTKIASDHGTGFILESPTWRSSADWGAKLGYDADALADANRRAIELMSELRGELNGNAGSVVISGCLGPRGDGYVAEDVMTADESFAFHRPQVQSLKAAGADLVTATTMTNVGEAAGIVLAAEEAGIPCVVSFTVETDGRLPDGDPAELASQYAAYRERFPSLNIFGGCCGTDARHVEAIAEACA